MNAGKRSLRLYSATLGCYLWLKPLKDINVHFLWILSKDLWNFILVFLSSVVIKFVFSPIYCFLILCPRIYKLRMSNDNYIFWSPLQGNNRSLYLMWKADWIYHFLQSCSQGRKPNLVSPEATNGHITLKTFRWFEEYCGPLQYNGGNVVGICDAF